MNWLKKFMIGRYGMDQLSMGLIVFYILLAILSRFMNIQIINIISLIVPIVAYYRIFSRNINKRYQENMKFLKIWNPIKNKFNGKVKKVKGLKDYKYFKCPSCSQSLRVPRGKGKIAITCPKCKTSIIKKS
jgi:phage FluMu protein Com